MQYIVVDLEATCWERREHSPNETIEIGAVLIDGSRAIHSEFEQFVKPLNHPILSDFCKELTSIQQSDVNSAPYFPEALERFKKWFGYGDTEYCLCSWGFYDKLQLENDCNLHGLGTEWAVPHISLKHQYGAIKSLRRGVGMKTALRMEGMSLEGRHHRGIDDAKNIAKIFLRYFDDLKFPAVEP